MIHFKAHDFFQKCRMLYDKVRPWATSQRPVSIRGPTMGSGSFQCATRWWVGSVMGAHCRALQPGLELANISRLRQEFPDPLWASSSSVIALITLMCLQVPMISSSIRLYYDAFWHTWGFGLPNFWKNAEILHIYPHSNQHMCKAL